MTSVPAFSLKAVFGSLTAPKSSALCARYFRTSGLFLSIVPLLVTKEELDDELSDHTIPADPEVKNYSYTLVEDKVYYRENSVMKAK